MENLKSLFPLEAEITQEIIDSADLEHTQNCIGAKTLKAALGENAEGADVRWLWHDGGIFPEGLVNDTTATTIDQALVAVTTEEHIDMTEVTKPRKVTFIVQLLILIMLSFSAITSFAQDSTGKEMIEARSLTTREVYNDVKTGVQQLVANLQGPAKHVYEIYVRQHVFAGLGHLLIIVISAIVILYFRNKVSFSSDEGAAVVKTVMFCITVVIFTASMITFFAGGKDETSFMELTNPEFYAIRDIISDLSNLKNK